MHAIFFKNIKSQRPHIFFWSLVIFYLLLQLPFLTEMRPVMYDEPWYSSVAHNFSKGMGFQNTIVGYGGNTNFLFPALLGLFFHVFGSSLFIARLVAVLCGIVFLFIAFKIFVLLEVKSQHWLIGLLTLICVPLFGSVFRYARPEPLALVFVFAALFFYLNLLKNGWHINVFWIALSLVGAFLSHPYTVLFFPILGGHIFYLAIIRKDMRLLKYIILFSIIAVVGVSVMLITSAYYNYDSKNLMHSLLGMLSRTSMTTANEDTIWESLYGLIQRQGGVRMVYSLPLTAAIITGLFINYRWGNLLSVIALVFSISSFIVFYASDLNMLLRYSFSLSALIMPFIYMYFSRKFPRKTFYGIIIFLTLNISATFIHNITGYEKINKHLEKELAILIPQNAKVFGPLRFWFFMNHTNYISDHYHSKLPDIDSFEFFVTNSVDEKRPSYRIFLDNIDDFRIVYQKQSKQYGEIKVYKRRIQEPL